MTKTTGLLQQVNEAAAFIQKKIKQAPRIGVILGSGLGSFTRHMETDAEIPYETIPHFPSTTVEGHSGKLITGVMEGKPVAVMAGRFHYYEGYTMQEVTFPVRVMKALGIEVLMISNAAGGLNPQFKVGDLMLITDHINLQPEHPLRGVNDERLGPRFPDMGEPYTKALIAKARHIAAAKNILLRMGVYAGVQGPSFETHAEYKYLHGIGADAVGMSTVPEVIVGVHAGLKILAMSVITDIGISDGDNTISHEEVLAAARASEPTLTVIFREMIRSL